MPIEKPELTRTPEQRAVTQERRRKRQGTPFGSFRAKLSLPVSAPSGEVWTWVNDSPGELAAAESGDWSFVTPKEAGEVSTADRISRFVGTDERGNPLNAFLMKMPKDWYDEDQRDKLAVPTQIDQQIRKGLLERASFKDKTGRDTAYVPSTGIKMEETS